MQRRALVFVLALVASAGASGQPGDAGGPPETALARYVAEPDSSYAWRGVARHERGGVEVLEQRLVSQTWQGTAWKHRLFLIKPRRLADAHHAVLVVAGGRWRERYETQPAADSLDRDIRRFARIAKRLGTVVGVVEQVPFQPLFDLTEDRLIAYTFERYLETGDAEWPLLLPMVKSAVRAMDAVAASAAANWGLDLETFTVAGGSKRGWTSWLTAAVDDRVTAVAPVVIDALNFAAHFPHQLRMWGAYSEQLRPYVEIGFPAALETPSGQALAAIVDPYSYRAALDMPKLVGIATNDRFFPVDSLDLYWSDLPGPKYVRYFPNNRHNVSDFRDLVRALGALNRAVTQAGPPLPDLAWEFDRGAERVTLCVAADPMPRKARLWVATSPTLDFRAAEWESQRVRAGPDGLVIERARPASGYFAMFAELGFGRGRAKYSLSTALDVLSGIGEDDPPPAAPGRPGVCPGGPPSAR